MLAGSAMSMRMSPDFDPAVTMSWRGAKFGGDRAAEHAGGADEENAKAFGHEMNPGGYAGARRR